jgi:hypothetical protein
MNPTIVQVDTQLKCMIFLPFGKTFASNGSMIEGRKCSVLKHPPVASC